MASVDHNIAAMKNQIAKIWNSRAQKYDSLYGHGLRTEQEAAAWLRLLGRLLPPSQRLKVLDLGAGTGFLAMLIAKLGHQVTGLDFAHDMITVARTNSLKAGQSIEFVIGDVDSPPFIDDYFDAVISRALLWTLVDPEHSIKQWIRVVKPAGKIIAIEGIWHDDKPVARFLGECLAKLQISFRRRSLSYDADLCKKLPLRKMPSAKYATDIFLRAGLRNVHCEALDWIDSIERESMSLNERLTYRYHRFFAVAER